MFENIKEICTKQLFALNEGFMEPSLSGVFWNKYSYQCKSRRNKQDTAERCSGSDDLYQVYIRYLYILKIKYTKA
jgi:hypothetical protein